MNNEQFKKYSEQDGYYVLTNYCTPLHCGVEILTHDSQCPGSYTYFSDSVQDFQHPLADEVDFVEEDRFHPSGEPISYVYCAPLNERELRRAYNQKVNLVDAMRSDDDITEGGSFKNLADFYSAIIDRFLLWFYNCDLDKPSLSEIQEPSSQRDPMTRFTERTQLRRKENLRDLLDVEESIGRYDYSGGLKELAEEIVEREKAAAEEKDVLQEYTPPKVESICRFFRTHTNIHKGGHLTRPQRLKALFYWAHGEDEKLKRLRGEI